MLKQFFFILIFWTYPSFSYVCLHPLEEAALLAGKSKTKSLSAQIKAKEKELSAITKNREKLEEKLDDLKDELSNSLRSNNLYSKLRQDSNGSDVGDNSDVANLISDYMESEQDEWEDPCGNSTCPMPWSADSNKYFKSNGRISESGFCKDFSDNKKECERAIKNISKYLSVLEDLDSKEELIEDRLLALQDRQLDIDLGLVEEDETEAGGLCFECLDELRELDKPTTGQIVGNALSILAGGALSYFGYRAGRSGAESINNTRLRQGFESLGTAGPSWAGATLGLPFIANGIYGIAGGNSVLGNYACTPGFNSGSSAYAPFGPYGQGSFQIPGAFPGINPYAQ
ncbi:MAG: hypothetical protein OXC37_06600, partial [Bdellovibrionaceae bacterium]|nr:hypothetical protein [Pseudobdellovibrionaceae bacterium]